MKGRSISYSAAEMAWLEANRAMVISDYHRAFSAAFGRDDVSLVNLHSLRKRKGWKTGRTGCFPKGNEPWNTGLHYSAPGSEKTRFQKGHRGGKALLNHKPIGTERRCKDGYLERKIHDGLPMQSRWRAVHLIRWEAANGPLPAGQCLKCLDGDRLNTDPANWAMIPRALLPRLNGGRHKRNLPYDAAAPEVRSAILTIAKVEHRARELSRKAGAA